MRGLGVPTAFVGSTSVSDLSSSSVVGVWSAWYRKDHTETEAAGEVDRDPDAFVEGSFVEACTVDFASAVAPHHEGHPEPVFQSVKEEVSYVGK